MALEDAGKQIDRAFTGGPRGAGTENTFAGATSFLRRRYTKDLAGYDLAVLGVPFDQAVTNRPGTRLGPRALREASALQVYDPPWGWNGYDPLERLAIADYGDVAFDYARPVDFPQALQAQMAEVLAQGVGCITLGGDHSITLPILRAHAEKHGPLALVQFDAHSDTWADDNSARFDHGTFGYKAVREGLIDPERSVQIGIRTVNPDPLGILTISARDVHESSPAAIAAQVRGVVGEGPAYVTFDIDALDPAFAPGTGTPVWGGLQSWQAQAILRDLEGLPVVGGDIVEVSPPFDTTGATAIAGAHVAMELICLWGRANRP